eukprot:m.173717 g.173717  ORF g.173717 m.173717 type:complete len:61 (+) comp14587_c0_seq3:2885-3067(+)
MAPTTTWVAARSTRQLQCHILLIILFEKNKGKLFSAGQPAGEGSSVKKTLTHAPHVSHEG